MPCRFPRLLAFTAAPLLLAALAGIVRANAGPDFNREVRPILSRYCFKCHGPDEHGRKGGLRLDLPEAAMRAAKSGAVAVIPGQADESELCIRIFSADADEIMPPPDAKMEMTPAQKEVLKRWIAAGADYRPHWSFVPPRKAAVPDGAPHPVDGFIDAKLKAAGLARSPEADRATLIRRVSYDLIGLPPTPEEVRAFETDGAPDAYERLVDRLLATPQYGERWARRWLDLARYADSNGYEKDRERQIWPFRDWVVQALNRDQGFDEFSIEQIAGDLLPEPSRAQLVATGFHRNTMLNEEGGIDPLEFRYHAMADRVATTGATWLGLTTGCAQCHTHKFDPITHREYFGLFAFLNNADELELDLPPADAAGQQQAREARVSKLLADLPARWPLPTESATSTPPTAQDGAAPEQVRAALVEQAFEAWLVRERARSVAWIPLRPDTLKTNLPLLTVQPDLSILATGDISKSDTYELGFALPAGAITAIRLEALPDDRLPAHGPGMCYYEGPKGDFFLGEFQLAADGQPVGIGRAAESYAHNNFGGKKETPTSAAAAADGDPQTGWSCADRPGEAHEAIFVPASPVTGRRLDLKMLFGRHYACSLGRFRVSVTTDARGAAARPLAGEIEALLALPEAALSPAQRDRLREHFLLTTSELAEAAREIRALRRPPKLPTTLIFRERPPENPRPTFLHHRGEYLQPTERVEPAVLAVLPPLPPGPRDRLAFARWLVARENPLTARVVANRAWAAFFGRGIVRTTEDFGYQGEMPSHPELLDWLAVDLMERGWSLKKLHRLIVTSATYRQSSRWNPAANPDPENRLLARFPRVRLEAEMIRDGTLRAAGLLALNIGGPPVKPPQPEGVSEVAYGNPKWAPSAGADRYRRSLYTFVKRTAPFALYNTFDAPTGEACIPRRDVSNTPLQALALLNDVVMIEAAQALGRLLAAQAGSDDDRFNTAFLRLLARPARADELPALRTFLQRQRERFRGQELDPAKFAGAGAEPEAAAWTAVARALFNLDEAVTKN